jgi:hypothetical protein
MLTQTTVARNKVGYSNFSKRDGRLVYHHFYFYSYKRELQCQERFIQAPIQLLFRYSTYANTLYSHRHHNHGSKECADKASAATAQQPKPNSSNRRLNAVLSPPKQPARDENQLNRKLSIRVQQPQHAVCPASQVTGKVCAADMR